MMIGRHLVILIGLMIAVAGGWDRSARAETNIMLIVDASGSMKKKVDGEQRMTAAKRVLAETLATLPAAARLGLLVYGHRTAKDCSDMELVSPIGAEDAGALAGRIKALKPIGETPIAASLELAAKSFTAFAGQNNSIVLVTDGIEECAGDPCAAARAIGAAGLDLKVNVVGFTLKEEQKKLIQCVADETGGTYYDASNSAALSAALASVAQVVQVAEATPPDDNILAAQNGGTLLAAPSDEWLKLNDGAEERATTYTGAAGWAFKEGKPATFDNVEVLIPATDQYNLKDFEVLVGDEGPLGAFRPVGQFTTQNIKMMQAPYQRFTFPAVTARYLKVVFNTDHGGGYVAAHELRVHGTVDEAAEGAAAAAAPAGIDLLSPANGGALLAAPSDEWAKLNDGAPDRAVTYSGSAVWGFNDQQPASFNRFEMLIPATDQYNAKEFELFVGDEGPTGAFRSIGPFTTVNVKLMQSPYQAFTFPPVTGRYLKVELKTDCGGGYVAAYDFRLIGQFAEANATATQPATPAAAASGNLLDPAMGGALIAAPNDEWLKLNDGKEDRAVTYAGEGIWAFKDQKPATIDGFDVLIPATDQYNLKEFELLVGDDGVTGAFRSIGTFSTQNIKMMQSPYQHFSFPPVTARYLKVVLKSDWGGGYIATHEFRATGALTP